MMGTMSVSLEIRARREGMRGESFDNYRIDFFGYFFIKEKI
jgi:hypothetical protein